MHVIGTKPFALYSEIDPFAAQWLRNLIAGGHIAPGEVDERSIEDVSPDDLRGFTQCHFFAGIGVWSHSLRLAGWPDDKPVWTGSCPCQPFSAAGKGDGFADERHLWPHFFHLISERRPQHVFGEQVAAGNANVWFDLVQADLEGMDYAFGLVPFTSAGIGAPHIRERAYWVAHANSEIDDRRWNVRTHGWDEYPDGCNPGKLANTNGEREESARNGSGTGESWRGGEISGVGDADITRLERLGGDDCAAGREGSDGPVAEAGLHMWPLEVNGFWRDADWLLCRDGKWRPVEPGTFPLVDGAAARLGRVESGVARLASSNRVGRLKGYGNAINAQAATEFIRAYMEGL
ncbi:DNA cytosine methyltransferase [Enterobacter hormaechei]|uniref:DNA cytosine methyltransferase n=1 Tax=Enterobacter hormaechei TaxID=158836 RepID=UPI0022EC40DD|nr:DNA cytosine methyltransferase [Enterobacter hormaechei]WBT25740.1 DNA cytosine methyltransferase [Enterobacter hormaechei]